MSLLTAARKLTLGTTWLSRVAILLSSYTLFTFAARLIFLSFMTYFLIPTRSRLGEISETFTSSELMAAGISAFAFVLFIRLLYPLTISSTEEVFSRPKMIGEYVPGFLKGALTALAWVTAMMITGHYRYLGFLIQHEDPLLALAAVALRILAIFGLTYCEEFLFRHKVLAYLKNVFPAWGAILISSIAFCLLKSIQFDLGAMQMLTLFLFSLLLGMKFHNENSFVRGAGFIGGMLIAFHPVLSLPIFGSDFAGALFLKYSAPPEGKMNLFLTGGIGGPLSSFALQILLILEILRQVLRISPGLIADLLIKIPFVSRRRR